MIHTRCHDPYIIKSCDHSHGDFDIPVNCGNCAYCVKRRVNEWAFRMMEEHKKAISAHFVTLTYHPDSLPFTKKGFRTLRKRDLQNFFKRLRYYHNKKGLYTDRIRHLEKWEILEEAKKPKPKITYFACGEYGGQTKRPHYHAIIFNAHQNDILKAWEEIPDEDGVMRPAGGIFIGKVNTASCKYVAKYIQKQNRKPFGWPWDGQPEYMVSSNGIGKGYLTDEIKRWHKHSLDNNYCTTIEGYKISMPRYYREKIWESEEEKTELINHISEKLEIAYLEKDELLKKQGSNYITQSNHVKAYESNMLNMDKTNRNVI